MEICEPEDLTNEASVESLFTDGLVRELGFTGKNVKFKTSISSLAVNNGRKKVNYRPDYILLDKGLPIVVIDAKGPAEKIEDWEGQCSSYCLELNKDFDTEFNPVRYYVISNGNLTNVYYWDHAECILSVTFDDFREGREPAVEFFNLLCASSLAVKNEENIAEVESKPFELKVPTIDELTKLFADLHQKIRTRESKNANAVFNELIKLVFVKISKDKKLHENFADMSKVKYKDVVFSNFWIDKQLEHESPINDPLFTNLVKELEKEVRDRNKKRIFNSDEYIHLSAETISYIVSQMEHIDFFAMEEDVSGRMFETFLDASARGKELGQFFTPRDIVRLAVAMANPIVTKDKLPFCLDACCGSGGFLIFLLNDILSKISNLKGVTNIEKEELSILAKEKRLFGIDSGSDPAMYRIARMNMYLHGDGGSNIFYADSLYKKFRKLGAEDYESDRQFEELQRIVNEENQRFDLIVSNPPFSVKFNSSDKDDRAIMEQYDIAKTDGVLRDNLPSSVMFIERYRDLIANDGMIFAIIDDSILSSSSNGYAREYIRDKFIIKAVVSLPGDAFKRSEARVKTSLIALSPKKKAEKQAEIYMAACCYLGMEKQTAKRLGIEQDKLPSLKEDEINRIASEYKLFCQGKNTDQTVNAEMIADRLDVKYCINDRGRKSSFWKRKGYNVGQLGAYLQLGEDRTTEVEKTGTYPLLKVTYDGEIEKGDVLFGSDTCYKKLQEVHVWDLLISNMGFGRGAIGLVPPYYDGFYVSSEYTILTAKNNEEAIYYSDIMRSKEFQGDVMSISTGMNRGRVASWATLSKMVVPEPPIESQQLKQGVDCLIRYWIMVEELNNQQTCRRKYLNDELDIDGTEAFERWLSFKSPE